MEGHPHWCLMAPSHVSLNCTCNCPTQHQPKCSPPFEHACHLARSGAARKVKFGCNLESTSTAFRRIIHDRCASSRNSSPSYSFRKLIPTLEFPMRQQRTQRMSTPTPISPTPISRAGVGLPTSGYALIVDGRAKKEFDTRDRALKAARELKGRFPNLQVKVFDAEKRQSETIELAVA